MRGLDCGIDAGENSCAFKYTRNGSETQLKHTRVIKKAVEELWRKVGDIKQDNHDTH